MKETRVFNLIILDESGSMCAIKGEAISSVNESIQTIRCAEKENENQKHFVSLVTFNQKARTVYDCEPVSEIREMTGDDYHPDCCTALFDAMGYALTRLAVKVKDDDRVLVTIVTDGMENASTEYNRHAIKKLVEELKGKGWVFTYIGANQDVFEVAASMSIKNALSFTATDEGTREMTRRVNSRRKSFFARLNNVCFDSEAENSRFFDEE